jgi:ferric-dicitrate binding protein FerR (iron transport regulator)
VSGRDDEALIAALSEAARRVAKAEAAGEPAPGAWHRLEARRARQRGGQRDGRRGAARVALVAAACALVGAGTIAGLRLRSGRALTYDVGGGAIAESGYIRGAHDRAAAVRFSDGTRIDLGAGARMSVAAPGPHGARLRLEEGEAHFAVMHLPHAAWTVEAGPYTVEVIGTVFDVRWSSAEEVVEVRLQTGAVRVSGPLLAEHATLRSGQHLTARLATRELRIDENAAAPAAPPLTVPPPGRTPHAPAAAVVSPAATAASPAPAPAATAAPPAHPALPVRAKAPAGTRQAARTVAIAEPEAAPFAPEKWSVRVSSGDAAGVVDEAVARGLDDVVEHADGPALVALADAARYAGRKYLAERVLRAQRTRFPGTPAAESAAFFLGRLADDRGAPEEGLDWYRRYLDEAPRGPYASEALGRAMLAVAHVSGRAAARPLALEYLQRFPDGTYLLHAQAILQGP